MSHSTGPVTDAEFEQMLDDAEDLCRIDIPFHQ